MPEVDFFLNGNPVAVAHDAEESLLEVLRERLGITSAKDGCAPQGFCGCCTVLVDGRPALACLTDAARVAGKEVTTLEGLPEQQRKILAEAFEIEGGVQCGFCTPGIAVRAAGLLERGQAADPARVKRALRGHLCRCTGYGRIVDAVVTAGEMATAGRPAQEGFPRRAGFFGERYGLERSPAALAEVTKGGVGSAVSRLGVSDQVLGAKPFVADLKAPGMLHAAVVLSAHPRAVVRSIDVAPAAGAAGVERILTAADVPGARFPASSTTTGRSWWPWGNHPVRRRRARGGRGRKPPPGPPAADAGRSRVRGARAGRPTRPLRSLRRRPGFTAAATCSRCAVSRGGDVEAALAESAHVLERDLHDAAHRARLPRAGGLPGRARDGGLHVYSQGQGVYEDRRQIAALLGLDERDRSRSSW